MPKPIRILAVRCAPHGCALTLAVSSCAETTKFDAAGDVHAFLTSIRDGDNAAFNAHVDREALKVQIRARVMAEAAKQTSPGIGNGDMAGVLAVLLGGPLMDKLSDRLIQPDVFRAVADYLGYSADTPIPGRIVITQGLRSIDGDHVCAARNKTGPCILTFRDEDGVWKP